jgi:hypothetical protein
MASRFWLAFQSGGRTKIGEFSFATGVGEQVGVIRIYGENMHKLTVTLLVIILIFSNCNNRNVLNSTEFKTYKILYNSENNIYIMDKDGSNQIKLTNHCCPK